MRSEKPNILLMENPSDLARKGALMITSIAERHVAERDFFSVALSGGSSPRPLHGLLVKEPCLSRIPWDRTHVFWVDERCVPEADPASNYGAARADFLDRAPIPSGHIHKMPGEMLPEEGAKRYQEELIDFFQLKEGELPAFDLILLGIGVDGHIASLFPRQASLKEREKLIVAVKGGDPFVNRLTMTFPVINNARKILFIAQGKGKVEILRKLFNQEQKGLPAQMVQPVRGELTWLIDRDAAAMLHVDTTNG